MYCTFVKFLFWLWPVKHIHSVLSCAPSPSPHTYIVFIVLYKNLTCVLPIWPSNHCRMSHIQYWSCIFPPPKKKFHIHHPVRSLGSKVTQFCTFFWTISPQTIVWCQTLQNEIHHQLPQVSIPDILMIPSIIILSSQYTVMKFLWQAY